MSDYPYDTRGSDVAARAGSPSIGDDPTADPAWGANLTKALGELSKGANAQAAAGGSGQTGVGAMSPAQSAIGGGGGGASQLNALVALLAQRYQALYPGGGSSKGLLGV